MEYSGEQEINTYGQRNGEDIDKGFSFTTVEQNDYKRDGRSQNKAELDDQKDIQTQQIRTARDRHIWQYCYLHHSDDLLPDLCFASRARIYHFLYGRTGHHQKRHQLLSRGLEP